MLSLNTIKKSKGSHKNKKRVGRGNASGRGTYSTRGQKGQRQRAGVSNLKRLGMKSQLLQTPKVRGFKSDKPKNQIVSVKAINNIVYNKAFASGHNFLYTRKRLKNERYKNHQ